MSQRIPIYLVETEVGPGLPTERVYWQCERIRSDEPIGWIVLPDGMTANRFGAYILFERPEGRPSWVDNLPPWMAIQSAIAGEHGLRWEAAATTDTTEQEPAP